MLQKPRSMPPAKSQLRISRGSLRFQFSFFTSLFHRYSLFTFALCACNSGNTSRDGAVFRYHCRGDLPYHFRSASAALWEHLRIKLESKNAKARRKTRKYASVAGLNQKTIRSGFKMMIRSGFMPQTEHENDSQ